MIHSSDLSISPKLPVLISGLLDVQRLADIFVEFLTADWNIQEDYFQWLRAIISMQHHDSQLIHYSPILHLHFTDKVCLHQLIRCPHIPFWPNFMKIFKLHSAVFVFLLYFSVLNTMCFFPRENGREQGFPIVEGCRLTHKNKVNPYIFSNLGTEIEKWKATRANINACGNTIDY